MKEAIPFPRVMSPRERWAKAWRRARAHNLRNRHGCGTPESLAARCLSDRERFKVMEEGMNALIQSARG